MGEDGYVFLARTAYTEVREGRRRLSMLVEMNKGLRDAVQSGQAGIGCHVGNQTCDGAVERCDVSTVATQEWWDKLYPERTAMMRFECDVVESSPLHKVLAGSETPEGGVPVWALVNVLGAATQCSLLVHHPLRVVRAIQGSAIKPTKLGEYLWVSCVVA
jgi:hypothetical protein